MSKKEKNIELTLGEADLDGQKVTTLQMGSKEIGYIKKVDNRFEAFLSEDEKANPIRTKTESDAISELIKQFHLHFSH